MSNSREVTIEQLNKLKTEYQNLEDSKKLVLNQFIDHYIKNIEEFNQYNLTKKQLYIKLKKNVPC
jgi:hypothetical protein